MCPARQTPEEGWKTYRPKRCRNNNKDEDYSLKTLNDIKFDCKYFFPSSILILYEGNLIV